HLRDRRFNLLWCSRWLRRNGRTRQVTRPIGFGRLSPQRIGRWYSVRIGPGRTSTGAHAFGLLSQGFQLWPVDPFGEKRVVLGGTVDPELIPRVVDSQAIVHRVVRLVLPAGLGGRCVANEVFA